MIGELRNIYKRHTIIVNNIGFLMILQVSNYVLPFITEPYLIRTLGVDNYGKVSFSQLFMGWLVLFVNYGFDLSATRKIAVCKNDHEERSSIFLKVMMAKLLIFALITVLFAICINNINQFSKESTLHYYYFLMVIGTFLFPVWFFQGMEEMKYITYFNLIIRIFSTIFIFWFIKSIEQYIYVALIRGLSYLIIGAGSLVFAINKFNLTYSKINIKDVFLELQDGFLVFWSTIIVSFYRIMPAFIVGLFYNYELVGYYNLIDKIIKMLIGLLDPIKKAIFPYFSQTIHENINKGIKDALKISKYMMFFSFIMSLTIFIFSKTIVLIMIGEYISQAVIILRIFSILPIIVSLAGIYGTQLMLNLGLKREFSIILTITGIISLICLVIFIPIYGVISAAVIVVLTELSILIAMYFVLKNRSYI